MKEWLLSYQQCDAASNGTWPTCGRRESLLGPVDAIAQLILNAAASGTTSRGKQPWRARAAVKQRRSSHGLLFVSKASTVSLRIAATSKCEGSVNELLRQVHFQVAPGRSKGIHTLPKRIKENRPFTAVATRPWHVQCPPPSVQA